MSERWTREEQGLRPSRVRKNIVDGVSAAKHGTVSRQNGVVHFNPEADYFGNRVGLAYGRVAANEGRWVWVA